MSSSESRRICSGPEKKRSCGDSPRREEWWDWLYCWTKAYRLLLSSSSEWKSRISRADILCYGCSHNGHQIDKVIIVEHIDPGNEPAGIIDQGNDIDPVFFSVRICKAGTDTAVPAPDFVDMGAFISAHILVRCLPQFQLKIDNSE